MEDSRWFFLVICIVAIIKYHKAVPVPESNQIRTLDDTSLELNDLDLASSDEASVSQKSSSSNTNPPRGKRTVGFLRTLFPNLSQLIDRKIQQITRLLFRVIGRLVLRGGNGGGGGDGGDSDGRKISITLPTYPPSEEDEEDSETETEAPSGDAPSEDAPSADVPSEDAPSADAPSEDTPSGDESETESSDITTTPDSFSGIASLESGDNQIAESQAITKIARKARDTSSLTDSSNIESSRKENNEQAQNDVEQYNFQDDKSSEDFDKPIKQEDDGKSKRQYFKFGSTPGGASGNILFDLIRILTN